MARRLLPVSKLWKRHEVLYVEVFSIALTLLVEKDCPLDDEDKISERLCPHLKKVCFEKSNRNRYIPTPQWEGVIQPVNDDELRGGKSKKRPDFTCLFHNSFTSNQEEFEIALHIECKRLGMPTSKTWVLNKNYVTEGIKRFDSSSHEYGKRASSGLMIGYVINMELEQIVSEVNKFQKKELPHNPTLLFQFNSLPVFKETQMLKRKNVNPKSFQLIHLWADLRNC